MNGRSETGRSGITWVGFVTLCALGMILAASLIGVASVGLAAVFSGAGRPTGWDHINEAFGVVNSVFSALALIVVGLTLWVPYRELKMQRGELHKQRLTADRTTDALQKTAEASLRGLHVDLLQMAIADPALAEVWPSYGDDVSADRIRQYPYANLILQHPALAMRTAGRDPEYVRRVVRQLFANPIVREFWELTMASRGQIATTDDHVKSFEQICDEVFQEWSEDVIATDGS